MITYINFDVDAEKSLPLSSSPIIGCATHDAPLIRSPALGERKGVCDTTGSLALVAQPGA